VISIGGFGPTRRELDDDCMKGGVKPAPDGRNVVFKSVGIAIEDIAAAELVYRKSASRER